MMKDDAGGMPSDIQMMWLARLRDALLAAGRLLKDEAPALAAGALGSLAAIVAMGLLRVTWGTLTLPELLGNRILPLLNTGQFVQLLVSFAPHQKTGPLALTLLGQFVVGVLLGPLYARLARSRTSITGPLPRRRAWLTVAGMVAAMELLAALIFWPVLNGGLFGDPLDSARLRTLVAVLLTFAVYGAVTALADHWLRRAWAPWLVGVTRQRAKPAQQTSLEQELTRIGRRDALVATGAAMAALAIGTGVLGRIVSAYFAEANLAYEGRGTPAPVKPITPADQFYVVSQNVLDPTVSADRWRLEMTGHVRQPRAWTYDELRKLPAETRAITLECISNEVGGSLISTAVWRGVTLEALLGLAGGAAAAGKYVIFYSVDGYSTSLPLADLLAARTLLAWEMNGQPLPDRHGFPLRAVVPGRYGEQSAKWITRIALADQPYKGLYQSQGWSDAPLSTMSRIDTPGRSASFGAIPVAGIAFGGTRGIRRVEVSADGGATWHDATLDPPLSEHSWVLWRWTWQPAARGAYTLVVRATDGTGAVQTPTKRGTVPNGSTGWHQVKVTVS